eukprot:1843386-Prorocentrum_lima.AAC.1
MDMEHHKVVQSLEETAQSHHNPVVRKKEEDDEAPLQLRQTSVSHEHTVLTSNARKQEQHVLA